MASHGFRSRLELALFGLKNLFVNQTSEMSTPTLSPAARPESGGFATVPAAAFVPSFICVERGAFGPRAVNF